MKYLKLAGWGLLVAAGFWIGSDSATAGEPGAVIRDENWKIEIRPAARKFADKVTPASNEEAAPAPESVAAPRLEKDSNGPQLIGPPLPPSAVTAMPVPRMSYAEAYAAVPFSRTEYEANPGYRQQAAMELMFGTLRPLTMVQNYTPRASRYPDFYQMPYGRSDTQHINIRSFGGGYNFNGQSPFGYPYGLRGNW